MPVPVLAEPASVATATAQPSQKSMTKAERRELQERQRAAKLLYKQQQQAGPSSAPAAKSKPPPTSQKKTTPGSDPTKSQQSSKDAQISKDTGGDLAAAESKSRGLRIFSHFSLPKELGYGVKGDIHPVIVRLGLQFSEFKICGANARCIATLTAFKTVCSSDITTLTWTNLRHRSSKTMSHLQIIHSPDI